MLKISPLLNQFKSKHYTRLLMVLWLAAQTFAYFKFGVIESVDTAFYTEQAKQITVGHWPTSRGVWYISYSSLLAGIYRVGGQAIQIVVIQVVCSGLALVALYQMAKSLFQSSQIAFIAGFLYILWVEIHQWALIVYTDSLFTSCVILSIASLYFASRKWHYLVAGLLIAFTLFIRPAGLSFFIALIGYASVIYVNQLPKKYWLLGGVIGLASCYFAINWVMADYIASFLDSYAKAEVIYPDIPLWVEPATQIDRPSSNHAPLIQLVLFILYNPVYFFKLSILKGALFLGHIKPYYSTAHNIAIGFILYPLYYFAMTGFRSFPSLRIKTFAFLLVLVQTLTISFTSENWDGRFLLPILPWVFLLAAWGISYKLRRIWSSVKMLD